MVRFRPAEIREVQGWTAYRLAQETDFSVPAAYRMADPDQSVQRVDMTFLDTLCRVLKVQSSQLLEWTPDWKGKRG